MIPFVEGQVLTAARLNEGFGEALSPSAESVSYALTVPSAAATTLQERNAREVWFEDFLTPPQIADGMSGAPTIDLAARFQAAIDACCPLVGSTATARPLRTNLVAFILGTTANMTNSRASATRSRDGFVFRGNSMLGTQILGRTGYNHAVIETTGSQWLKVSDVFIGATGTQGVGGTASSVGIFMGVSTALNETQNQKYERIYISMPSDPTANQGLGTIGLWNYGSEENTFESPYITADLPMLFTSYSSSPNTGAAYGFSFQTLSSSHSTGVNTFTGESFIVSLGRGPSLITEDVNSLDLGSAYLSCLGTSGSNDSAWRVYGALQGAQGHGTIEGHGTALEIFGTVTADQIRFTFGNITNASAPRILLQRGGAGAIINSEINFQDNVSLNRPTISAPVLSANEVVSCYIANTTIAANCDKAYLTIPENTKWNPKTAHVELLGWNGTLPYRMWIGTKTDRVDIPPKECYVNGSVASAEVVRVALPTIVGGANALGCRVHLRGLLSIESGGATNGMSALPIDDVVAITLNPAGVIQSPTITPLYSASPSSAVPSANNISAGVVTAPGNTTYVAITVTPTRTGANAEPVIFTGSAELIWGGNESRAPSLQLV